MRHALWLWALGGCYQPPELPLIDEIPIEGRFPACADPDEDQEVACVVDGDTLDLGDCGDDVGLRVRMLAIDAPETEKPGQAGECWADEAHAFLQDLLLGEEVTLTFDRECTDRYGRTLAYLWARDDLLEDLAEDPELEEFVRDYPHDLGEQAILLNEVVLALGMAHQYPEEFTGALLYQDLFDWAAQRAEARGLGLWGACDGAGR